MCLRIVFAALLLLSFALPAAAQERHETSEQEQQQPQQKQETRLFDEFGAISHCDLGARIQNLYIEVSQNPGTRGYIIIYRGADSLPANQSPAAAERQINRFKDQIMFLNLKPELIEMVDGGLRKNNTIWNEVWIVPDGGAIPMPSATVEKSKLPVDKSFKVDERGLYIYEAQIEKPDLIYPDETETPSEEDSETAEANSEENLPVENTENQTEETTENETSEFSDGYDPYSWISVYFAESLRADKKLRGVVIFYADESEYDVAKLRVNIDEGMRKSAAKSSVDLSGVKIIYGGNRKDTKIEFWIVPPGAKEPVPTPEDSIEKN